MGEVLVRARALLRGKPAKADAVRWSDRLTRLEDWLELHFPRCDRSALRQLRHQLDDVGEARRQKSKIS